MNRVLAHNRYALGVCITLCDGHGTPRSCSAATGYISADAGVDVGVFAGFDEPVGRVELGDEVR